jgi:two-component system chemotaxis response regulator CheB
MSTEPIKVLVVDTSANVRKILTEYLSSDPAIEVVGVATNLSNVSKQIENLHPDIVTLHEDLYDQALFGNTRHNTDYLSKVPLVVLGNIDEATKLILSEPADQKHHRSRPQRKRAIVCKTPDDLRFTEICKRIHQIIARSDSHSLHRSINSPITTPQHSGIIGIAVSTGGPNALIQIVSSLSPELAAPILITQHMPEQFTPLLVERLNSRGAIRVYEAQDEQPLEAGNIYVAPGDRHLKVAKYSDGFRITLWDGPKENSCRPSADVMFRSMADNFGSKALGLVLTGMGIDGQRGCQYLKDLGGSVIAQDEHSSTVWGMPKAVISAGLADEVMALGDIAEMLNQRFSKHKEEP